ncbi:DUF4351 domain-containing protein [candidate division KSB1 bacterium]|nr:DUF4351 domain-containing protein [candidate division KSB1 bacterium]
MQEIDHAIKTVFSLNPNCFLDLTFGSQRKTKLKEIADPQINVPELRADKAVIVEDQGKEYCIIYEAMLQPDQSELPTFALKALGNQYMSRQPTLVVIVYLEKRKYASFPNYFENRLGDLATQFVCNKILLWEHKDRILNGELKELAPFLPLLYERPDPGLIEVQKSLLAQTPDPKVRADLTATAILVDIRAFGAEIVLTKFSRKELKMLKETSIVQEWLTESQQEGKREGKREGKLSLLEVILAQKLGALSPELMRKLQKLNDAQLNRLGLALHRINSRKALQAWLQNGASGNDNK